MITEADIARINELANKKKTQGLTEAEAIEQQELRQRYILAIRGNVRSQLDNASFVEKDGSLTPLKDIRLKNEKKRK